MRIKLIHFAPYGLKVEKAFCGAMWGVERQMMSQSSIPDVEWHHYHSLIISPVNCWRCLKCLQKASRMGRFLAILDPVIKPG